MLGRRVTFGRRRSINDENAQGSVQVFIFKIYFDGHSLVPNTDSTLYDIQLLEIDLYDRSIGRTRRPAS